MPVTFGSVKVGIIKSVEEFKQLLMHMIPESDTYIVKPNWYSPLKGGYTDAEALDLLLSVLPGKKIVIEGYSLDRQDGSTEYKVNGEKVNWRWLLKNPDLDWIKEAVLENIRQQDRWFRDNLGISRVLEKNNAEYISVTEEVLSGRVVPFSDVKRRVESHFPKVQQERLYGYMPSRLMEYAGKILISYGHVKGYGGSYPSLTLKNMFGLIPDPMRSWWHGPNNSMLDQSIIDTVKLYSSYFQIAGICEAINTYTINDPAGDVKAPWGSYSVGNGKGFIACGVNLVEVDAVLSTLIKVNPANVSYINLAEQVFGKYQRNAVASASTSSNWFNND